MDNEVKTFLAGFATGMVVLFCVLVATPNNASNAHDAIKSCEAELPRDQQCKITAIPE